MANVTLRRHECRRDGTPRVCLVCGKKGAAHRKVTLQHHNSLTMAAQVLTSGGLEWSREVWAPLCAKHATAFSTTNRLLIVLLGVGGLFGSLIGSGIGMIVFASSGRPGLGALVCLMPGLLTFFGLAIFLTVHFWGSFLTSVQPTHIDRRGVTLSNVHSRFLDALDDQRDREEDEELEDRPPRTR
jgi:hypothetical protein